jgi:DNA-binding NarL/FixJ family response regulator
MSPDNQPIRLLLIDDHTLFRQSLARLLEAEDDFELVADFSSVDSALDALNRLQVDVVLLDFDLGERNGLEFFPLSKERKFFGHTLVVTGGLSSLDTLRVLKSGASGIFLKHSSPADLLLAIRKIVEGETWLDPKSVDALVTAAFTPDQNVRSTSMTSRQKDILRAVFEGLSNKEIAARHDISETYVKAILQQLFDKTGVRSRSQLVRVALENPDLWN